jgi:hypothetical protein
VDIHVLGKSKSAMIKVIKKYFYKNKNKTPMIKPCKDV